MGKVSLVAKVLLLLVDETIPKIVRRCRYPLDHIARWW
jgi:hypothetical protein